MRKESCFFIILTLFSIILWSNACANEKTSTANNSPAKNNEENRLNIENKILSLCEIGKNPAEFDGKTVRLKARLTFGTENTVFSDQNCHLYDSVVTFEKTVPIEDMRKSFGKKEVFTEADIDAEANFINKPHTECCTTTKFQFKVTKIFDIKPIVKK